MLLLIEPLLNICRLETELSPDGHVFPPIPQVRAVIPENECHDLPDGRGLPVLSRAARAITGVGALVMRVRTTTITTVPIMFGAWHFRDGLAGFFLNFNF